MANKCAQVTQQGKGNFLKSCAGKTGFPYEKENEY